MPVWEPQGFDVTSSLLGSELAGDSATSLGRAGAKVEHALAELRAFRGAAEERDALVKAAADAVYGYFVQRELLGMPDQDEAIRLYHIPGEVLARVGGS